MGRLAFILTAVTFLTAIVWLTDYSVAGRYSALQGGNATTQTWIWGGNTDTNFTANDTGSFNYGAKDFKPPQIDLILIGLFGVVGSIGALITGNVASIFLALLLGASWNYLTFFIHIMSFSSSLFFFNACIFIPLAIGMAWAIMEIARGTGGN